MTTTQTEDSAAATAPETDETPAGPGLMKALESERELHKAEKQRANAAEARADDLADKLATAEARIANATEVGERALRIAVAAETGLDLNLAPRLTGTTQEELRADAQSILSAIVGSGGGFDGGARMPAPMKPDPAKQHGRLIADLMNGGDGSDLEENE